MSDISPLQNETSVTSSPSLKRPLGESNLDVVEDIPVKKSAEEISYGLPVNSVEIFPVPENVVGLVIGKGGAEIRNIQLTSGCHVQMDPDGAGANGIRGCRLEGSQQAIAIAKQMIQNVIAKNQAQNSQSAGANEMTVEILVPADKCGLIIGKAGETIRNLQEQTGCRMQVVQDTQAITGQPKPLKFIGTPETIEAAKQLVNKIIEAPVSQHFMSRHSNNSNTSSYMNQSMPMMNHEQRGMAKGEVIVPRSAAGLIIGKGGDTIKRLAMETGTKIQFKPDEDPTSPDRCAVIMGTRDQIFLATDKITEIVNRSQNRQGAQEEFYLHVPANKCGLVIGKGGDTIKQIERETGASCGLAKDYEHSDQERVFYIRGTASEINHASHLMRIKVGDVPPNSPIPQLQNSMYQPQQQQPQQQQQVLQQQQVPQNMAGGYVATGGNYQPLGQQMQQQQYMQQTVSQWQQPAQQQMISPYQQQQQQMTMTQVPIQMDQYGQQQQVTQQQQQRPPSNPVENTAPVVVNPSTGQPDYSAHWAAYYRSIGLMDQAAMVEGQMKLKAMEASKTQQQQPQQQYAGYGTPASLQ